MRFNGMQRISEYTQSLSAVSRARYESKVTSTGLNTDPYAIDDSQWSTSPEAVPDLTWSDMVLYMISTPSPYTKEAGDKGKRFQYSYYSYIPFKFRPGRGC